MSADGLGDLIAAEEHRQGMPYGPNPGHCEYCDAHVRQRLQLECPHDHWVDITRLGDRWPVRLCQTCSLTFEVIP